MENSDSSHADQENSMKESFSSKEDDNDSDSESSTEKDQSNDKKTSRSLKLPRSSLFGKSEGFTDTRKGVDDSVAPPRKPKVLFENLLNKVSKTEEDNSTNPNDVEKQEAALNAIEEVRVDSQDTEIAAETLLDTSESLIESGEDPDTAIDRTADEILSRESTPDTEDTVDVLELSEDGTITRPDLIEEQELVQVEEYDSVEQVDLVGEDLDDDDEDEDLSQNAAQSTAQQAVNQHQTNQNTHQPIQPPVQTPSYETSAHAQTINAQPNVNNLNTPNTNNAPNTVTPHRTQDILSGVAAGYVLNRNRTRPSERPTERSVSTDRLKETYTEKIKDKQRIINESSRERTEGSQEQPKRTLETELARSINETTANNDSVESKQTGDSTALVELLEKQKMQLQELAAKRQLEVIRSNHESLRAKEETIYQRNKINAEKNDLEKIFERGRDVRTMNMHDLLEVAEHIHLEGTNLRQLYELKRIDAVNLRRVIIEYMNGGNRYEKVLRSSLEAVEMQRELRNEVKSDQTSIGGAGSTNDVANSHVVTASTSNQQDAGQNTSLDSEESDDRVENGSSAFDDLEKHRTQETEVHEHMPVAVIAGIVVGIVLMIMIFLISKLQS